jgi:CheY-like chemotaxis protein
MTKTVLDVGNCDPDHSAIKKMLTGRYDVLVLRAQQLSDARSIALQQKVDLILINRKLDIDYSDGVEVLRQLKQDPMTKNTPMMIITNYSEHQQAAVADGAEYGFGKLQYAEASTHERLAQFLHPKSA